MPVDVFVTGDLSQIEDIDIQEAQRRIAHQNEERQQEAEEANKGGDPDDFRYLRAPLFLLETKDAGTFVASITAGGKTITYALHARVLLND